MAACPFPLYWWGFFCKLLGSACDSRSRALALSSTGLMRAIGHCVWNIGLVWGCMKRTFGALCVRDQSADVYSDRQVGCGRNSHRIHWHDFVRNALFSVAQTTALAPRKVALSLILGTNSRPADIHLPNWKTGQPVTLGVSVILTMQQRAINGGANSCGYALRLGEERKMRVHAELCIAKESFCRLVWRL